MDIRKEKEEILRLIGQLQPGAPIRREAKAVSKARTSERISRRRHELLSLKRSRDRLEMDLIEERLLRICQMLEERVSKIEEVISTGTPLERSSDGTNIASNQSLMKPGLNIVQSKAQDDSHSLSGRIEEGILADILQLLSGNGKTGTFTVDHEGQKIDLFFREGHLYHASGDKMSGQSAFFAAMAVEGGMFYFNEGGQMPDETTIDGNTQFMILEALRQIDEESGKQ